MQLAGSKWIGTLLIGCDGSPTQLVQSMTLTTKPWGSGVWVRGGRRTIEASISAVATAGPAHVAAVRTDAMVPLHGISSIRFGTDISFDEAYWEVVSAATPRFAVSTDVMLTAGPPLACADQPFVAAPEVALTNAGAVVTFVNDRIDPWATAPVKVAACLSVGVAPVSTMNTTRWPVWRSLAAATRFSYGGVTEAVTTDDGGVGYASTFPVWDDGTNATIGGAGYPYRRAVNLTAVPMGATSPWVGLLSTVAVPKNATAGRSAIPPTAPAAIHPPPPSSTPVVTSSGASPVAMTATAISFVASAGLLFVAAIVLLGVAICRRGKGSKKRRSRKKGEYDQRDKRGKRDKEDKKGRRQRDDNRNNENDGDSDSDTGSSSSSDEDETRDTRDIARQDDRAVRSNNTGNDTREDARGRNSQHHTHPNGNKGEHLNAERNNQRGGHHGRNGKGFSNFRRVGMMLIMMPCMASACDPGIANACAQCLGTISPSTCQCSCGWSKVESIVYSMFLFLSTLIMLLYT